jgi:SSS family solute:Na+ symporter
VSQLPYVRPDEIGSMALTPADLFATVGYFALIGIVAYYTRRVRSFRDFSVGEHSVPATMIFASLAATIVGPGFSIGFAGRGWTGGYFFYFLVLAYALQVIFVGVFLTPRLAEHRDCQSLGDLMRKKYGGTTQVLTGVASVGLCIGFAAVTGKVGALTLQAVTHWPMLACLAAVIGTTALIAFSGGVRATIATEAMQFALMTIVIGVVAFIVARARPIDVAEVAAHAAQLTKSAAAATPPLQGVGVIVAFMLGEALIPPYANRAFAARDPAVARLGFVLAGGFCVAWLAMITFIGVAGHAVLPPDTQPDDVLVQLARAVLPAGAFGLLLAAILAIVMSSMEAMLNSGAVAFVRDIVSAWRTPSEAMSLRLARGSTLVFAGVAIVAAQFAPDIIDGLLLLYSIWAPAILVPLVFALCLRDTHPMASWLSILGGGGGSLVWQTILHEPGEVPAILVGITLAVVLYGVGHLIGQPVRNELGQGAAP